MRPRRPPEYSIHNARRTGYAVLRRFGRRREWLGRDGYWARTRDGAVAFTSLDSAVRAAGRECDLEIIPPISGPEVHATA